MKKIERHHFWLGCMAVGPLTGYLAVFYPPFSILSIAIMIIGVKGVMFDVL